MYEYFLFSSFFTISFFTLVYYDDGTYDYFQAQEYTTSYNIITAAKKNAEAFIICTAELDKWESCNWIDLSNTVAAGSSIPEAGDNICQLGYRWLDSGSDKYKSRASAIIIAAYETPDTEIVPPSYAQYEDIQDFSLSSQHRINIKTMLSLKTFLLTTKMISKSKIFALYILVLPMKCRLTE